MASEEQLVQQIVQSTSFFASQVDLLSPSTLRESAAAMSRSIVAQIASIQNIDMEGATRLNNAIRTSGFETAEKLMMGEAVSRLTVGVLAASSKRGLQTLSDVQAYFTENDWNTLNDQSVSLEHKIIKVIVERMALIGLRQPNESTNKSLVALIGAVHFRTSVPTPASLHNIVGAMKTAMQARRHSIPNDMEYLLKYPDIAINLPEALWKSGYPNPDDPPVRRLVEGYLQVLSMVPMRVTHHSIAASAASKGSDLEGLFKAFVERAGVPGLVINRLGNQAAAATPRVASLLRGSSEMLALQDSPPTPANGARLALQEAPVQPPSAAGDESASAATAIVAAATATKAMESPQGKVLGVSAGLEADGDDEGEVAKLERMAAAGMSKDLDKPKAKAKGKGKAKGKAKAEAKAKAKAKAEGLAEAGEAKAKGKAKAKEKAKAKGKAVAKAIVKGAPKDSGKRPLQLGCSKCRGSPKGCGQCKDPSFKGKRFTL